jgi:hypothetical protein
MNEEPGTPQEQNEAIAPFPISPSPQNARRQIHYWTKRLLACNPAYLISAALLLYGLYRISLGPLFLSKEVAQLSFNFGSLQCYEVALVVIAIFLWRIGIRYDSLLLVILENPFYCSVAIVGQKRGNRLPGFFALWRRWPGFSMPLFGYASAAKPG